MCIYIYMCGRVPMCPLRERDCGIAVCVGYASGTHRVCIGYASGYGSSDHPFCRTG